MLVLMILLFGSIGAAAVVGDEDGNEGGSVWSAAIGRAL